MGRIKDLKFYVEFMAFGNCKDCEVWKRIQPWGFEEYGKWKVLDLCKNCIWQRRTRAWSLSVLVVEQSVNIISDPDIVKYVVLKMDVPLQLLGDMRWLNAEKIDTNTESIWTRVSGLVENCQAYTMVETKWSTLDSETTSWAPNRCDHEENTLRRTGRVEKETHPILIIGWGKLKSIYIHISVKNQKW